LQIDRTSTQVFGTDLFLKVVASAVNLKRDDSTTTVETTRTIAAPELTLPVSIGSVARIIPLAGYTWTNYSENTLGVQETRALPYFRIGLEGPRPYRIWDLSGDGRFTKLKHLLEPRISYVYTPEVNQDTIPQFDSFDQIPRANRMEYSLSNTLYAKKRVVAAPVAAAASYPAATTGPATAESAAATEGPVTALEYVVEPVNEFTSAFTPKVQELEASGAFGDTRPQGQLTTTQELLWVKLSQNYTFDSGKATPTDPSFTPVEWEVRTRPLTGLEVLYRGNFDVYGQGVGYQNLSLTWRVDARSSLQADWRTTRDSNQDFLDVGGNVTLGRFDLQARSRYNIAETTFVENRLNIKYVSQCWDVTLGVVKWTESYEYSLLFSLKGIGTIVRI
jgi:hypothetical protein